MKKVVILLLLLIPLIVLFTISASGMIISAEVAIEIETFELWHLGERVTEVTIAYDDYANKNRQYQLLPRYFPEVAQVSGFRWYSDNDEVATVDKDGKVTFHECGVAKITAQSLDSVSIKASCMFFVEDEVIHKVRFYSYDAEMRTSTLSMRRNESKQIQAEIIPYVALSGDPTYTSSDPSVFTCDPNGVITARGEGSATLTLTAKDKKGKTTKATLKVQVSDSALVSYSTIYVCGDALDLTPYLTSGSVEGGNILDLREVAPGGETRCVVRDGSRTETVTVVRLAAEKVVAIEGWDAMRRGAWMAGNYIATGRSVKLAPIDPITREALTDVTVTSSDPKVIKAEGNTLYAKGKGRATVTFSKQGYEPCVLTITAAKPISYFSLNINEDDDAVGLGSQRVYGTMSVYEGEIREGIRILPEKVYPADGDRTLFAYYTDSEYASVDDNGVLTFREDAVGKSVTVTVKSLLATSVVTRSYTFKNIVKGVNVGFGYGANTFDDKKGGKPSFAPYYDALKVMDSDRDTAIVFQTNIYLPSHQEVEKIEGANKKLTFTRDIYGNGHKLDGQFYQYRFDTSLFEDGNDEQLEDYPDQTGITITDLFLNSYAAIGVESAENFAQLMKKGGITVRTYYKKRNDFEIRFRYCVFQYAYSHYLGGGGTVLFDGCIFRNSAGMTLLAQSSKAQKEGNEQVNDIKVNNCIFSNSISLTGLIINGSFPIGKKDKVCYNSFAWTGTNYIYNWKKSEDLRLDIIPTSIVEDKGTEALMNTLNMKINECARNSMIGDMNAVMKYKKGKITYVNMGVLFIDYWKMIDFIINEEREKVTDGVKLTIDYGSACLLPFKMNIVSLGAAARKASSFLMDLDHANMMLTNKAKDGSYNTEPGETYKLDQKTFRRVRGEV